MRRYSLSFDSLSCNPRFLRERNSKLKYLLKKKSRYKPRLYIPLTLLNEFCHESIIVKIIRNARDYYADSPKPSSYEIPVKLETQIPTNHIPGTSSVFSVTWTTAEKKKEKKEEARERERGRESNAAVTIGANSARDAIRTDRNRAESKRGDRMILTNLGKNVQTPFELVANWLRIDN